MRHVCDVRTEDLGPYLLGSLQAPHRRRVAAQIEDCPACAAEVRRLQPVVAAMSRARPPAEDDEPATIAPTAMDRFLARVERERRSRTTRAGRLGRRLLRPVALVAAAAALVAAAVVGVLATRSENSGFERELALTGTGNVSATAALDERSWGTRIDLDVRGLTPGETYGAWLERPDGSRVGAGTFRPGADGRVAVVLTAGLPLGETDAVGVSWIAGEERADILRAELSAS